MKPLHDVVLIRLADVMKELMKIDRGDDKFKHEGINMQKALHKFENEGKADKKQMLFPLWREYHNGSEEVFEQICLLPEAYGLIVPIKQPQCYYSMSLVSYQTLDGILPETKKNSHILVSVLKMGFFAFSSPTLSVVPNVSGK